MTYKFIDSTGFQARRTRRKNGGASDCVKLSCQFSNNFLNCYISVLSPWSILFEKELSWSPHIAGQEKSCEPRLFKSAAFILLSAYQFL